MSPFKDNVVQTPCGGHHFHRFHQLSQPNYQLQVAVSSAEYSLISSIESEDFHYYGQEANNVPFESELSMCKGIQF